MTREEFAEQAALRVTGKNEATFGEVRDTFVKNAGYTEEFITFHKERDGLLEKIASHQKLSEKEGKICSSLDALLERLIMKAPDGHIHGYLIGIGHIKLLNPDPIACSATSVFYKQNPAFFHELTKFFDSSGSDFFEIRQILTNNSLFADTLKLYLDRAHNFKPGDYQSAEWLETVFKQLKVVSNEISFVESKGQKIKDSIVAFHKKLLLKGATGSIPKQLEKLDLD